MVASFFNIMLFLDSIVYNLIDYLYDIFYTLAGINVFSSEDYNFIVGRIYVILGLIMLFVLTYSLLRAVIDPESFSKGESSFSNLAKNVVMSLVIIIVLPVIFSVAFNVQNTFLNNNVIPKLILGEDYESEVSGDAGREISYNVFYAFFHEDEEWCTVQNSYDIDSEECADNIAGNGWFFVQNGPDLKTVKNDVEKNGASFRQFAQYGEAVEAGQITYMVLISTVAGIFVAYVLLNFCFDMGIRVVKLAFYQIIAPIPVVCRILPGGKMKDVFSKWVKQVVSIFAEVFIRIAVIFLGIFMITLIVDKKDKIPVLNALSFDKECIVIGLLIMGVVAFMRQAPKLIGDILNLDTGGMKLGLMDKLAMGGGLVAGAAVGGLATTGLRNAVGAFAGKGIAKDFKNKNYMQAFKKIGRGALSVVPSTLAGAGSGMVRAGYGARNAKSFKEMKDATSKGVAGATMAKTKRENYKAAHRVKVPVFGGILGAAGGHIADAVSGAGRFVGFGNIDALKAENAAMAEITDAEDAFNNEFEQVLLKKLNKGENTLAGENLGAFKLAKEKLDQARLSGANVAGAEKAYKDAIKAAQKALHGKVYASNKAFNALSESDQLDLGTLRVKAVNYVGAIRNNAALKALQDAGVVGTDFSMDKGINEQVFYKKDANGDNISVVSKMKDNIKLTTNKNDINISVLKQNDDASKKNNS